MDELIEALKERQGHRSQEEFAAQFGITQSALSKIYAGKRDIGKELASKIAGRYPELAPLLAAILLRLDRTQRPVFQDRIALVS